MYEIYVKFTLHVYITRQLLKSSASKYRVQSVSLRYKHIIYYNNFYYVIQSTQLDELEGCLTVHLPHEIM